MPPADTSAVAAPTPAAERVLAPDLLRGAMLLAIALANAAEVLLAAGGGLPLAGIDRLIAVPFYALVHSRAYPVFAIMFGYGIVQLAARQAARGLAPREIGLVLARRHVALVAFGLLHAAVLYHGDFLGAYGIAGLLAAWLLAPRADRGLARVRWIWMFIAAEALVLAAVVVWRLAGDPGGGAVFVPPAPPAALTAPDYLSSAMARLRFWPGHTVRVVPFVIVIWLGMWAARHQVLEHSARHRRVLSWTAAACLLLAIGGGTPMAMMAAGVLRPSGSTAGAVVYLHQVSGMFGGPGYAAAGGLLAARLIGGGPGVPAQAACRLLASLGQRSLSGYLFQSAAWLVLFAPFALGVGRGSRYPLLIASAIAFGVWLLSLVLARLLARRGRRGPAETLLRRITYRPARRQVPVAASSELELAPQVLGDRAPIHQVGGDQVFDGKTQ